MAASADAVTVAVVSYNGGPHLEHCFRAIRALEGNVGEVLLVDNASTDGSVDDVRTQFPEVRIVPMEENAGPCPARNRAIAEAAHARVFLLDCDVVPAPDALVRLTADLDAHEDAAIAQPRAVFAGAPERVHYDGGWFSYTGLLTLENFGAAVSEIDDAATDIDAVISMALLVDRPRLDALGVGDPFDPLYFIYFEDTDVSYRIRLAGGRLRRVPKAVVLHREGTAGVSYRPGGKLTHRRARLLSRNRWVLMLKTYAWPTLLLTMPAHLVYELVQAAFLTVKGQPHGYLLGKVDVLRDLGAILRGRRAVKRLRRVRDGELLGFRGFSFVPLLEAGAVGRAILGALNAGFGGWWKLVRWML